MKMQSALKYQLSALTFMQDETEVGDTQPAGLGLSEWIYMIQASGMLFEIASYRSNHVLKSNVLQERLSLSKSLRQEERI